MAVAFHLDGASEELVYDRPLLEAQIIERPNRYVAQVAVPDGTVHRCFVPVGGRIGGLTLDGLPCLLSGPYAKGATSHTVEAIGSHYDRDHLDFQWIGINQGASNRYVGSLLAADLFPELSQGLPRETLRRERKLAGKRIDFSLGAGDPPELWIEVKTPLISVLAELDSSIPIKTDFAGGSPSQRMPEQFLELAKERARGSRVVFLGVFGYDGLPTVSREERFRANLNLDGLVDEGLKLGIEFGELEFGQSPQGLYPRGYRRLFED